MVLLPLEVQGTPHIVDDPFGLDGAKGGNPRGFVCAEPVDDVLENGRAVRFHTIDVDISDLNPILVAESGKHRVPRLGIQVNDVGNVGHPRAAHTASGCANGHALLLAPGDELAHGKHKAVHVELAEDPHLLLNGREKGRFLLWRNDAGGQLILEFPLHRLRELLCVRLPGPIQDGVLNGGVQLEGFTGGRHAIGVLNGLQKDCLWKRTLPAEGIHQLIVGLVGKVKGVLVPVTFVLGLHQDGPALGFVRGKTVGVCPGDERFTQPAGQVQQPPVKSHLVGVGVGLDLQVVVFLC